MTETLIKAAGGVGLIAGFSANLTGQPEAVQVWAGGAAFFAYLLGHFGDRPIFSRSASDKKERQAERQDP